MQPESRAAFERLTARLDRRDPQAASEGAHLHLLGLLRNAHARDAGIRIDHSLLDPTAAKRLKAAGVDREVRGRDKASDHAPTWVELKGR